MAINWEVILWTCVTLVAIMGTIALILIFISGKNMRKKRAEMKDIHSKLRVGSLVMFAGGVYGRVVSLDKETARIEVARDTVIKVSRYAIQSIEN